MKIFSIVGKADKRPFTYPFIRALAFAGKTLVLTDDVAYRRLYKGYESEGEINDVIIDIIPDLNTEKIKDIIDKEKLREAAVYDYILVITDIIRCPEADATLCVCAKNKSFLGVKLDEFSEKEPEVKKTYLSVVGVEKKEWEALGVQPVLWTVPLYEYLCECEERQSLIPFTKKALFSDGVTLINKPVVKVLEDAFLKEMEIRKDTFEKLLKRSFN